jgi:hypothetical protein
MLVQEQENVKRVQLADKYLSSAALGDANDDAIKQGTFLGKYHFPSNCYQTLCTLFIYGKYI